MSDIRFDIAQPACGLCGRPAARRRRRDGVRPHRRRPTIPASSSISPTRPELLAQAEALGAIRSRGEAALGHSLRGQGQHRRRRHADHGGLPGLCLSARQGRDRRGAAQGGRRAGRRQDQSRPVRHRPCRRAHALSDPAATPSIRRWCRAAPPPARRWRRRAASSPSRSAPTRRAPAASRPGLNNIVGLKPTVGALSASRRRAGLPHARLRLDLRADRRRRLCGLPGRRRHGCGRSLFEARSPCQPLAARPPVLTVGVPAKADLKFFGDAAMAGGFDAALATLAVARLPAGRNPVRRFLRHRQPALRGRLGGRALCGDRATSWTAHEDVAASGHADRSSAAPGSSRRPTPSRASTRCRRSRRSSRRSSPRSICSACRPRRRTTRVEAVLADPIATNSRLGTYTNFVNLLDMCGIAVPTGKRSDGLPMSVTLLARRRQGRASPRRSPATSTPRAACPSARPAGRCRRAVACRAHRPTTAIELAVVGAHLSGMPLNGQLKELGARFCRAAQTSPAYRLYALAGQAVPKPGLMRVANGGGAAIDVEVWRLGRRRLRPLRRRHPAAARHRHYELDDGTTPKAFWSKPPACRRFRHLVIRRLAPLFVRSRSRLNFINALCEGKRGWGPGAGEGTWPALKCSSMRLSARMRDYRRNAGTRRVLEAFALA